MKKRIDEIVKKYSLFAAIDAECKSKKTVPFSVKRESDIYRKHIFRRIKQIRDLKTITEKEQSELNDLNECIKLINDRERDLLDSDID